jgi:tripartite-type tricarboxylate transporter receptor subunit TctC
MTMTIRIDNRFACSRKRRILACCAMLVSMFPAMAHADEYPTKTIAIIVPFPPGGAADQQARLIAHGLTERLGKPVIVENHAGASGEIGASVAARSVADGYTLLLGTSTMLIDQILRPTQRIDAVRDLAPVALIAEGPLVLVASPSLGINTVSELLTLARQHPGQLAYASFGAGTHGHLAGEMLKAAAHVDLLHVPYKGGAPALAALLGGHVGVAFVTALTAGEFIRAGKLTGLAVTGSRRLPSLPDVPTMAEAGVPGYELELWSAILAPAKTPPEIIARLNAEIVAVIRSVVFKRYMAEQGGFVVTSRPEEVSRRIQSDLTTLSRQVKAVNLKADE